MTSNLAFVVLVLAQLVVTFGLLGFAFLTRETSPGVADVVVGAAVYHWLRETASLGRQAHELRQAP